MGGDHKCPVCQATFTRPQHVARHMRSHTGDRPYKCQFCGDQFARSDLLARHVNKCHANEKPPPNTAPGARRKGSAAVSRATTSKQACDQCVEYSLPCDGSNPCSKCVSRKYRCTYVKFHRQTAPSGPGHYPPRSPSSPSSSSLAGSVGPSRFLSHFDDIILPSGPPITPASFPGPDQIFHTPLAFNPAPTAYPPNWSTPDMSQLPFSMPQDADIATKYRTQAESLRRAGPPTISNSSTVLPSIYSTQQQPSPSSQWYPVWGEPGTYPPMDDNTKPIDGITRTHSFMSSEPTSFTSGFYDASPIGSAYRPRRVSLDFSDSSSATSQSIPSSAASSNLHLPLSGTDMYDSSHSEEMPSQTQDVHIQRRSSIPTSQPPSSYSNPSDPVTAASAAVPVTQPPQRVGEGGGFSSAFGLMSIDDPNVLANMSSSADGVPFFSNLGVGVLPHSPNATPMPTRVQHNQAHVQTGRDRGVSLGALPTTPGSTKEAMDTRELRDMWKTYMRSPLSGSGSGTAGPDVPMTTSPPMSSAQIPLSPSGQRRRMRVSSLPSVTPTVEKGHPWMSATNGLNGHGQPSHQQQHGESGSSRMHHGGSDDLRSYEAAVNARNASLKLNLVPRRRGTRPTPPPSTTTTSKDAGASSCSPVVPSAGQATDFQAISRPASSSSSSSLAQAFCGLPVSHQHHNHSSSSSSSSHVSLGVIKSPPLQGASISLPIPPSMLSGHPHSMSNLNSYSHSVLASFGSSAASSSSSLAFEEPGSSRASSVTSDGTGGTGGSGSDGEISLRPSFKRYPSQTLGPASSKRALVERGSGMVRGIKVEKMDRRERGEGEGGEGMKMKLMKEMKEEEEEGIHLTRGFVDMNGSGGMRRAGAGSPGSRPIAALPERAKRG